MSRFELNEDKPILTDKFKYFETTTNVLVHLFETQIVLYDLKSTAINPPQQPTHILSLKDLAGSMIGKSSQKNDKNAYLTLYAYPKMKQKNKNTNSTKRKRITVELTSDKFSTYDENLVHVNQWHKLLEAIIKKKDINLINNEKPYLIFVNPKSGAGKAKNIYFERIVPIWAEANIPDTLFLTEYTNHARDHIKKINVEDYRGIIVVSGDGLVYEIINGLMEREDWQTAIKTPICQIPGGSANALACCLSYVEKEPFRNITMEQFATSMSFNLIRATPAPMDLIRIQLADQSIVHSFLNLEWAIIADVDLESEKYRYLGGFRFVVGAIKRIISLRIYRGRISFLPSDDMRDYKPKGPSINMTRNTNSEEPELSSQFKYLPPFNKPVPNDWLIIEDNFILFLIVNLPLIAPDFMAVPDSNFNDGNMHMIFIKEGMSKAQLMQLFSDTETGNHLKNPFVEYVKIKAFRLEPLPYKQRTDGILMVDGERVSYGNIQGEIMPSCANVLANY